MKHTSCVLLGVYWFWHLKTRPTSYLDKPNINIDQVGKDMFDGEVAATQAVGVNTQIRTTPAYVSPDYSKRIGYVCMTTGGKASSSQTYNFDTAERINQRCS